MNDSKGKTAESGSRLTRVLIMCGVAAGVLYISANLIQAFMREGFDIRRHPISLMILGSGGWVQSANFIVTGLLSVASSIGIRRVLKGGKAGTWGPLLFAVYGSGLIVAGIFGPDASFGFPPGTPEGVPATMSIHSTLHGLGFAACGLSFIAAGFVFARMFKSLKQFGWMIYSILTSAAIPVLIVMSSMNQTTGGIYLFGVAIVLSAFISLISSRILWGKVSGTQSIP